MPTQATITRLYTELKKRLRAQDFAQPFIAEDALYRAPHELVDATVRPIICDPLKREFDRALASWREGKNDAGRVNLIVLPPCDNSDLLRLWAERNKIETLRAPDRSALCSTSVVLTSMSGSDPLVLPHLEHWFLRTPGGLAMVRRLLDHVAQGERPVLVGCNSWAWRYLVRAVDADVMLPPALMFEAFDAARLFAWFCTLVDTETPKPATIRLTNNGEALCGEDLIEGSGTDDFFRNLAATAHGIPWVARALWEASLRRGDDGEEGPNDEDAGSIPPGETTLWVSSLPDFALPEGAGTPVLLTLHALLLHAAWRRATSVRSYLSWARTIRSCSFVGPALSRGPTNGGRFC